ncbi:MAG: GEVED domain-containing protein, partial [bacterium]|nr:GEVED domain-containing protein [bacterium]
MNQIFFTRKLNHFRFIFSFLALLLASNYGYSQTYCSSGATSTADDDISNVTILCGGTVLLNNSSICNVTLPQYSDYTGSLPATTLYPNNTYTLSVTLTQCSGIFYANTAKAWIDYNKNGTFDEPAELIATINATSPFPSTHTASFVVPGNVTPGITRLRIVQIESNTNPSSCGTYSWGETEDYNVSFSTPPAMRIDSAITTQTNTSFAPIGAINQQVIGVQVAVTGAANPLNITSLNFNTNGTTSLSDISNLKVWYTTSSSFDTSTQFGSTLTSPTSTFSISGNQQLSGGCSGNFFWLTYDVNSGATPSNILDAECLQINYDSLSNARILIPIVTAPIGNRSLQSRLNGNYTVGVSGDYPTITQALLSLGSLGAVGPVTFSLIDANYPSETFPITINAYFGMSAINKLTIRPDGAMSNVLIQNTNLTSGVFVINGAKYVTIDGRSGGIGTARGLNLVNFALTNFAVVSYLNDAISCDLKYCNIRSSNIALTGVNAGSVYIGNSTGFTGNDSITISNNYFAGTSLGKHNNSVYSLGQSANIQNNNITISQNDFNGFAFNGIFCNGTGNGSNWNVTDNSFYDTLVNTVYSSTWTAINLAPLSTSAANYFNVLRNYIGGSAPLCGGSPLSNSSSIIRQGILLNAATGPANNVYGNVIQNILLNGSGTSQFTGISVTSGAVIIDSNTIGSLTVPGSITMNSNNVFLGINSTAFNVNINVTRNLIANINHNNISTTGAIRGMNIGGSGINTIDNNIIRALTTNSANAGTTTVVSMGGIICSGSGTNNITNNQIGGGNGAPLANNCSTIAAVRVTGIYVSSGLTTITGNTIDGLRMHATATTTVGTTTSANMLGICNVSFTSGQVISNNIIRHLYINSAAAVQNTQLNAILYASNGSHTISGNTIYGIISRSSNISTATSSALNLIMVSSSGISTITNNYIDSVSLFTPTATTTTLNGIYVVGTTGNTISGNTIKSIYTNSTQTSVSFGLIGITLASPVINQSVINNRIYNLVNTNSAAVTSSILGIRVTTSTSLVGNSNLISRNLIHSFRMASTGISTIVGIQNVQGVNTFSNNMIRLGIDSLGNGFTGQYIVYGMHDNYSASNIPSYYYNNSVYLGGAPTSGTSLTACLLSPNSSRLLTIKNNILVNGILNGGTSTAQHHALRINNTFNITSNYNVLFAPNPSGFIASTILPATNYTNLLGATGWINVTKLDAQSGNINPDFVSATG